MAIRDAAFSVVQFCSYIVHCSIQ